MWWTSVLVVVSLTIAGCSSMIEKHLKYVSAGHTGCLPDENELSNVNGNLDGSGTWNVTCKGKVYLCSASGGQSESYSCAPVTR